MPKPNKSSASSGTRKKHARKNVTEQPNQPQEKEKGKKGGKGKKEPKQKLYIAPKKPPPIQPDPIVVLGLASALHPELLVTLRKLGKKDAITKTRALENLHKAWIGGEADTDNIILALPVWLYSFAGLVLHSSKRIRFLAASLQASLIKTPEILAAVEVFFGESAPPEVLEAFLGATCLSAHDIDRSCSSQARQYLEVLQRSFDKSHLESTLAFVTKILYEPEMVFAWLYPTQRAIATDSSSSTPLGSKPGTKEAPARDLDEEGEGEPARTARWRTAAIGTLRWLLEPATTISMSSEIHRLLENESFWTIFESESENDSAFGAGFPAVRHSAWILLQTLVNGHGSLVESLLPESSKHILQSAWTEPDAIVRSAMWDPLLLLLTKHPSAWIYADTDAEDIESGDEEQHPETQPIIQGKILPKFLQFMELGCAGFPIDGYPTIMVIISTIPSPIFPLDLDNVNAFFESFWAAVDGRAFRTLDRSTAFAAFLSSLLECTLFLTGKIRKSQPEGAACFLTPFLQNQGSRIWNAVLTGSIPISEELASRELTKTLQTLSSMNPDLCEGFWYALPSMAKQATLSGDVRLSYLANLLNQIRIRATPGSLATNLVTELVQANLEESLTALDFDLQSEQIAAPSVGGSQVCALEIWLGNFFQDLKSNPAMAMALDAILQERLYDLMDRHPNLVVRYLSDRNEDNVVLELWSRLLAAIGNRYSKDGALSIQLLEYLVAGHENGTLGDWLRPNTGEELRPLLDGVMRQTFAPERNPYSKVLLMRLLRRYAPYLNMVTARSTTESISSMYSRQFLKILHTPNLNPLVLETALELLHALYSAGSELVFTDSYARGLIPDIYLLAHYIPTFHPLGKVPSLLEQARQILELWRQRASTSLSKAIDEMHIQSVRDLLLDTNVSLSAPDVVSCMEKQDGVRRIDLFNDLLTPESLCNSLYSGFSYRGPMLTMINDFYLASSEEATSGSSSDREVEYDSQGLSSYGRCTLSMLQWLTSRRHLVKRHPWALMHIFRLRDAANIHIQIPHATDPIFSPTVKPPDLESILLDSTHLTAFALISPEDPTWHTQTTQLLWKPSTKSADPATQHVQNAFKASTESMDLHDAFIFSQSVQLLVSDATVEQADTWVALARQLASKNVLQSMAISYALTRVNHDSPLLDRLRNEIASEITGVPSSKANTRGLLLLRRLVLLAPRHDGEVVFMQPQRAVGVLQCFQRWVAGEEDIDDEVLHLVTVMFFHLAPIVQSVQGSHWELIFDILEQNLEEASFDDEETLFSLLWSLRLLLSIEGLSDTNKFLKSAWMKRQKERVVCVRRLLAESSTVSSDARPRAECRKVLVDAGRLVPTASFGPDEVSKLLHWLDDQNVDLQQGAFDLITRAVEKHTETLVVDVATDSESIEIQFPPSLVELVDRDVATEGQVFPNYELLRVMLCWAVVFDLFKNASLKVKNAYLDQLRRDELVEKRLLPLIVRQLDILLPKAVSRIGVWDLTEFHVELANFNERTSYDLLAANLYHRLLMTAPGILRAWWLGCKDRELTSAIARFTSTYYAPAIVGGEFSSLRDLETLAQLSDENFKIRVSASLGEVSAVYSVDDQKLEILLKVPADYPLHGIEVKDAQRIGVPENKWRSWLLQVQQTVNAQTGRMADGLQWFKKTISSHFEGQEECAICYSFISVTDRSLPNKPCKTCRNKFHASCLYKWFRTSHTSTCPLCRSEIM